jgi:hypothetical protein
MAGIFALSRKAVWLIQKAIDQRIASEEARYQIEESGEDADGDFGNDLTYLKMLRDDFANKREAPQTARIFQVWFDPADNGLLLTVFQNVQANRDNGQLSDDARLLYEIVTETYEEAMAIHYLRQGWAPYVPMGEAAPCPQCTTPYYPEGSGDCWRCGNMG